MKIVQVLDALDYGDGVSNDVINKYKLLKEMGYDTAIYSKWVHDKVSKYFNDIDTLKLSKDDILMHHFSGHSFILENIHMLSCKKVLVYHNITPQEFYSGEENTGKHDKGIEQLIMYKDKYDYFLGDSQFNIECLQQLEVTKQGDVLPILIDFRKIEKSECFNIRDNKDQKVFSFVGRVAENKKHEDVIDIFEYYYTNIDSNSKLILVGNYEYSLNYYNNLIHKLSELNCKNNVIFTGKIDDEELYNYFKCVDIFICMSEHEGFCIPLLESMYCKVPTMAFDACAIKYTMGNAGVLVKEKNPRVLAELAHVIISNPDIRCRILENQKKWVNLFSKENIALKLKDLIKKWQEG